MALGRQSVFERQQARRRVLIAVAVAIMVLAATATFAFQFGRETVVARDERLTRQIEQLRQEITALEEDRIRLRRELRAARQRAQQWYQRYQEDMPQGERGTLMRLIDERLNDGLSADRLAFVIENATVPRNCRDAGTKRFLLSTPLYQQTSNAVVSFDEGAISVAGSGVSARNDQGSPEAWYDPTRPVTISFRHDGSVIEEATGEMPMSRALIAGGQEYRFLIRAGQRGFARVTASVCQGTG